MGVAQERRYVQMEAMALESMVGSVWRIDGFLTVLRHPVRVEGGYTDIDVVGVRADGTVRIAECKARGPARHIYVESDTMQWSTWWDDAMNSPRLLWDDPPAWLPGIKDVSELEYYLIGNVWFSDEAIRISSEQRLEMEFRKRLPHGLKGRSSAHIHSSIDLLLEAIRKVREQVVENGWGKRYGDPLLDAIRELVRYSHPAPAGGGRVGQTLMEETTNRFLNALGNGITSAMCLGSRQAR
jgi:hypothetical protein